MPWGRKNSSEISYQRKGKDDLKNKGYKMNNIVFLEGLVLGVHFLKKQKKQGQNNHS
jgi:hypothetical protein